MKRALRAARAAGFTLLPVVLAMSLIAAIAFLLNRDNGMNAAMIASGSDLDRARYAAEAGLQAINYQVQQQGCGGGFPTSLAPVNSNFGGGAYSAYADKATGFPLLLSSTGSYNGASVTLSRANVQVFQSAMQTKVLQPDSATGQDTYVDSSKTTRNYGTSTILLLDSTPVDMLLKFDLSALPAGSRVIPYYDAVGGVLQPGANLWLYQNRNATGSGTISAYLVTHSWLENSATWASYDGTTNVWPGGGYDSRALAAVNYVAINNWYSWDITDAAAAWMGSVYPNYGVRLSALGTINNVWYVSSDDTVNVTLLPKVTLNYLAPCGSTTTFWAMHDTELNEFSRATNYGAASTFRVYNSGSHEGRGLLFFDLSSIPSGTTLSSGSAKLQLYFGSVVNPPSNSTLMVWQETTPWDEMTVTWKQASSTSNWSMNWGGDLALPIPAKGLPSAYVSSAFVSGWLEWDVTDLAQLWVKGPANGGAANYGLEVLIYNPSGGNTSQGIDFHSREGTNKPRLLITY